MLCMFLKIFKVYALNQVNLRNVHVFSHQNCISLKLLIKTPLNLCPLIQLTIFPIQIWLSLKRIGGIGPVLNWSNLVPIDAHNLDTIHFITAAIHTSFGTSNEALNLGFGCDAIEVLLIYLRIGFWRSFSGDLLSSSVIVACLVMFLEVVTLSLLCSKLINWYVVKNPVERACPRNHVDLCMFDVNHFWQLWLNWLLCLSFLAWLCNQSLTRLLLLIMFQKCLLYLSNFSPMKRRRVLRFVH